MDVKPLATFAVNARLKLIQSSSDRVQQVLLENSLERLEKPEVVARLERYIAEKGLEHVISENSYLWFNRFLALTMLDAIGFNNPKALSPSPGSIYPEILQEAKARQLDDTTFSKSTVSRVDGILSGHIPSSNSDVEAYALLIAEICRSWSKRFPMVFQSGSELAELLAPRDLLSRDSVRTEFIQVISGEYAKDVETIGWLFQFYNSDVKEAAYANFKRGKKATHQDLLAATQFFTPRSIAETMVENTIGAWWSRMHPGSTLAATLPSIASLASTSPEVVSPEQLTILDPAVGSGNLLLSTFDYLEKIYLEDGYNSESVPHLILQHNLYGVDIDPRAAALAAFALWLRASRSLQKKDAMALPQPNVSVLKDNERVMSCAQECPDLEIRKQLINLAHAGTLGTLVKLDDKALSYLQDQVAPGQLLEEEFSAVVRNAEPLTRKFDVVLANPPYMGPRNMPPLLKKLIEEEFAEGKADLYAAFLIRVFSLVKSTGRVGLITQASWLNLQRFHNLRKWLYRYGREVAFIRIDPKVFFGVGSFVDKALTFMSPTGAALAKEVGFSSLAGQPKHHDLSKFEAVKGMPFAFGLPDILLDDFLKSPKVADYVESTTGAKTGENSVFLRYWWEVCPTKVERMVSSGDQAAASEKKWFPFTKGGAPIKWYGNMTHVVNWEKDGRDFRRGLKSNGAKRHFQTVPRSLTFEPYICWSDISSDTAFRYTPQGFMPGFRSPAMKTDLPFGLLAFLNSTVCTQLVKILNPTINIAIADVERVPVLFDLEELNQLGKEAVKYSQRIWNLSEQSMDFAIDEQISFMKSGLQSFAEALDRIDADSKIALEELQSQIDAVVSPHYSYPWVDSVAIDIDNSDVDSNEEDEDDYLEEANSIQQPRYLQVFSLLMGLMTGRYSANKQLEMMVDEDNLIPLMSADYFDDDFSSRLPKVLDLVTDNLSAESLSWLVENAGMPIREFMRREFYPHHVKFHKGCPVYWIIRSPKGTFQCLTFIHRFNIDTLAVCRSKYVQPLIEKLRTQQRALSSIDKRKSEALEVEIEDLLELDNRLYALVLNPPLIDFDEGVVKNHARFASVLQKLK